VDEDGKGPDLVENADPQIPHKMSRAKLPRRQRGCNPAAPAPPRDRQWGHGDGCWVIPASRPADDGAKSRFRCCGRCS